MRREQVGGTSGDDTRRLRPLVRTTVGFLAALLFLAGFVALVGPGRVTSVLESADPLPVVGGACAAVLGVLAWSETLRLVLASMLERPPGRRFRLAYLAGDFTKQVLPMGHVSGPALMALPVSRAVDASYERTLGAITVSDAVHLLASIFLGVLGLVASAGRIGGGALDLFVAGLAVATLGIVTLVVGVTVFRPTLAALVVATAAVFRATLGRLVGHVEGALDPEAVERRLESYFTSLDAATADRRRVALAAGFAVVGWVLYAFPLYACAVAVGSPIPLALALLLVPVAGFATWLPVPGGTGGVEIVLAGGLVATTEMTLPLAAAVALLFRLCSYWTVVAVDGVAAVAFVVGE